MFGIEIHLPKQTRQISLYYAVLIFCLSNEWLQLAGLLSEWEIVIKKGRKALIPFQSWIYDEKGSWLSYHGDEFNCLMGMHIEKLNYCYYGRAAQVPQLGSCCAR